MHSKERYTIHKSAGYYYGIQLFFRVEVGFGDATMVPADIKMAVKELVAHMYENRGDQNEMTIPPHILMLVESYRRMKVGC